MTPLTPARTRDLLRIAVRLLDGADKQRHPTTWTKARDAFLADVEAALGVSGVAESVEALRGRKRGERGPDRKPRRKPGEKSLDLSPGPMPVSPPSRSDRSNPSASPNAEETDVEQIAATHTVAALRFQQMSL